MLVLCSPFATVNSVESRRAVVLRRRSEERAARGTAAFVLGERLLFDKAGRLVRVGGCWSVACRTEDVGYHLGRRDAHHRYARGCVGHPICYSIGLSWNKGRLHGWYHADRHGLGCNVGAHGEGWCWLGSCWRRLE